MKVLFIASKKFDYLEDVIFSGLRKLIGNQALCHWPLNYKYVFPIKNYPKNLGYSSQAIQTATLRAPDPSRFDVVVVGSCKPDTFESYLTIVDKVAPETKVVLIDGGDRPELGGDLSRLQGEHLWRKAIEARPFDFVFKREYLIGKEHPKNVFPFPFGFNFDRLPKHNKKAFLYDVSFWAVESDPIRTDAIKKLQGKFDCQENGTVLNQNFKKYKRKGQFYLEELSRCKVTLNFRGGGWDTLRFWEVPALGRFMISQKPGIVIPDLFEHEKHVVYCNDTLDDLVDLCDFYLKNDQKREEIAAEAYKHTQHYHSDIARARYLLQKLK